MKATKQESITMEGRTLRKGVVNVFRQRHQFSRELRHVPTLIVVALLSAIWIVNSTPVYVCPTISCPHVQSVCELAKTGASID